jgi:hypothetical protein
MTIKKSKFFRPSKLSCARTMRAFFVLLVRLFARGLRRAQLDDLLSHLFGLNDQSTAIVALCSVFAKSPPDPKSMQ